MQFKEVLSLIKACRANAISELTLGDLRIVIGDAGTLPLAPKFVSKGTNKKIEDIRREANLMENLEFSADSLAHALVEDPAEYERMIILGELEKGEETHNQ